MSWNILGMGTVIETIGKVADDLITSDEERLKVALQEKAMDMELVKGQLEINKVEAAHQNIWVAGWRPFIGWVGGIALAYQFIFYPMLTWGWALFQAWGWVPTTLEPPPVLDAEELWVILTGMLGIAGLRSFDKVKGTQTQRLARRNK
ncbi:MAG: holin family protein [Cellvibrionaceae bacterium]|nr:holin family protein [Cellvibrionaceae bacterium]